MVLTALRFVFSLALAVCSYQTLAAPVHLGKDIPYQLLEDKEHKLSFDDFLQRVDEGLPSYNVPFSRGYARVNIPFITQSSPAQAGTTSSIKIG